MNELLKSLACSGSECLCWILVLFNIFAVFYLVFCSFWKISRLVKISGWVYSGVLIGVTILTMFFHTCIYTLLATIFTGMMLMAILSIILPQQGERREKAEKTKAPKPIGAYVISETFDGWFAFGLYDSKRKNLVNSTYAYESIEMAKQAIVSCRESGIIAETEDRSGLWIQEKNIPKFEIRKYGEAYGFSLFAFEEDSIVHSEIFSKIAPCLNLLAKVKANIGTTDIYMSVEKICGDNYKKWGIVEEEPIEEEPIEEPIVEEFIEEPVEEELIEEEPIEEVVEEEPVAEEPIEEESVVEESLVPKKCIVGVVWPESSNPNKIYRYKGLEENIEVEVGDIVVAPTFDAFSQKEVVRKACVASVEYYEEGEDIVLPKKSIISVEKKSI